MSDITKNQDNFNDAVYKAIEYSMDKRYDKIDNTALGVYLVAHLIFLIWAIILVSRLPKGPDRLLHLILAVLFSPLYVLGYYISN
jgi:hypothetical protein